jgi:predicted amidohydrolase YtcJ
VIVLSRDLCEMLATEVGKTRVLLTVVNGKIVWREGI